MPRIKILAAVLVLTAASGATRAEARITTARMASHSVDRVLAAARTAVGGSMAMRGTLRLSGRYSAGDAPGTFAQAIDLRSGRNRSDVATGGSRSSEGWDGTAWTSQNGIVTVVDLPGLDQDARARAFLAREGWRDPSVTGALAPSKACRAAHADCVAIRTPAGSTLTIWIDQRTHLPSRMVLEVDAGSETTVFAHWRRLGKRLIAYRRTVSDDTGANVTYASERVTIGPETGQGTSRPAAKTHGTLSGGVQGAVPFEFTGLDRGHIVVPATVDRTPVRLILDTGGANYLTPTSTRELGLAVAGGVNIGGVGEGAESGGYAKVRELAIGPAVLRDEMAIVGPLPYPATRPRAGLVIAGLTGYELLSEFRTTIDYARREIAFAPFGAEPVAGTPIPFYSDGHSIYVEATIEGVSGLFGLDTGDNGTVTVFRRFADRHGLFARGGRDSVQAGGVGGAIAVRETSAGRLSLAGASLLDVPVSISDTSAGAFSSRTVAGNLGSAILSRFTLTFDYRARTLTLLPNDSVATPFARDRTGLSLSQTAPDAIEILSVAKGSSADRAGVRAGDRIVEVAGRSVARFGLGVFDLTPLRHGTTPFRLAIVRHGVRVDAVVVPEDTNR